uniref:hypothetical protein n=1 Tax=Streptomyces sp. NRRL S-475 TaxID=1463910 RepID=UPI0005661FA5
AKEREHSTAIVVHAETTNAGEIEGYGEIVANAAEIAAEGIKANVSMQETARKLAEAILDGRLRIFAKNGLPDLKGTRQLSKDFSTDVYDAAFEMLAKEGYNSEGTIDAEEMRKQITDKVQYQMTAVLPDFVRALDNSPEMFAEFFGPLAKKVKDGKKPSDVVFETYNINPKSKAELAAERRAAQK